MVLPLVAKLLKQLHSYVASHIIGPASHIIGPASHLRKLCSWLKQQ